MQNSEAAIAEAIKSQKIESDATFETATVKLPPDVLNFLRDKAQQRGVSTGDMLRIALGTQKFLSDAVDAGGKVLISNKSKITDVAI